MRDYTDVVTKARKGGSTAYSSAPYDATPIVERMQLEQKINLDTLTTDLQTVNQTIQTTYSGWQNQDHMKSTISTVQEMRNRLNIARKYKNKYAKDWDFDVDGAIDYYEKAIEEWEDQSKLYSGYQNADAFDKAKTKAKFDLQFSKKDDKGDVVGGLTFDEIQEELKKYEEGTPEHDYLKGYTNYSNLSDFDKAIAWAKGGYTNVRGESVNTEDAFKIYPSKEDQKTAEKQLQGKKNILDIADSFPKSPKEKLVIPDEANPEVAKKKRKEAVANFDANKNKVEINQEYVDALERARNIYKLDYGVNDYYAHHKEEEDFEELSKYKPSELEGWWDKLTDGSYGLGYGDITYEYINDVDGARSKIKDAKSKFGMDTKDQTTSQEKSGYDKLNPDEIKMYNYLYAKNGKESAQQYLDSMEVALTKRVYDEETKMWKENVDNPIGATLMSALSIPMNIYGGVTGAIEGVTDAIQGKEYNPYGYYKTPSNFATDTTKYVGENIAEATEGMDILGTNVLSFLYQTGMSVGNTVVGGATLGSWYSVVAGSNAFQQKAKDLTEAGENSDVVIMNALASGTAEILFEKASIDHWLKIKNVDGAKKFITETLKQAGIEGSEELLTELANIGSEALFRGDNSELAQLKKSLLEKGYSEEEANNEVWKQGIRQVGEAFAGGLVSGGVLGGFSSADNYAQNKSTGASIRSNAQTDEMWDTSAMTPEESETYKLYTKYAEQGVNAGNIKDAQLGNLYNTAEADAYEQSRSKKETDRINSVTTRMKLDEISTPNTEELRKQRVETLNKGEVTEVTATGNSTKIEGVKKVDGDLVVATSEGEFKVDEVTFSQKDAELLSYAENMQGETANMFVSMYDGKASVDAYHESFNLAVAYAENNISQDTMLENRGVLTPSQVGSIYTSIVTNKAKAQSKVIAKLMEKHGNTMSYKGTINDSVIDYNNKTTDGSKVNWNSLTDSQRKGVTFLTGLAKATGLDAELITDGLERGMNGAYMVENGKIIIDVYAGVNKFNMTEDAKDTIIPALSHELTHWSKAKSPLKYQALSESVFKVLTKGGKSETQLINEEVIRLRKNGIKADVEYARDEIIARACEDLLSMSETGKEMFNNLSESEQKSLVAKIKDIINDLVNWVNELVSHYQSKSKEAEFLRQYKDDLLDISKQWDAMLKESVAVNQAMKNEGITDEAIINETLETIGLHYDAESQSVAPMDQLSERTWTESEYVQNREVAVKSLVKAIGVTEEDANRYIDNINSIARTIADDRARLDYAPNIDEYASVLKSNSEYKWTVDMSTLCAKRLLFTGTFDAIQKALPNTALDSEDIVALRSMMMSRGYEVACGICYVESTRRELGTITQDFIERYKLSQQTGEPITRINNEGKVVELKKTKEQMKTTKDNSSDKFIADKDYTPTLADLNTTDIDIVKRDHPLVYEAYLNFMNARGQAKPKLLETRAEYKGEILKHFKNKSSVNARNKAGGLRLQSFSDFEVAHLIDMMQIALDMSSVGLMSQAYTKVPAFADVFGDTGIKINLSLIAKGTGLDENGNLIFDDVEGINHKEAFKLRDKYSKNVGTILVGKNDAHIIKAMSDSRIDYIIPFHKSSWKESLYDSLGLTGYSDYTDTQNEKPLDKGRTIKNFDPSEYWDFSKTGDENAQIYLQKCKEDGRIPKFPQFQGYEGYWKLLIDFKMYDNDGVGSPQTVVKPNFRMDEAMQILNSYEGGHQTLPVAKDVVDDFVAEYKKNHPDIRYSDRYAPTFYSHMGRVVDDIKQDKIGANSVVSYLKGRGVKDEEIKWSGIETFLEGKKSVTKAELQEFMAGSQLQIDEIEFSQKAGNEFEQLAQKYLEIDTSDYIDSDGYFDGYTASEDVASYFEEGTITEEQRDELYSAIQKVEDEGVTRWHEHRIDGGNNYRELLFRLPNSVYSNDAMQSHWGMEGILAHARMQDITTKDGKKMLFIEEIQSDWHNKGQKEGYSDKIKRTKKQIQQEIQSEYKKFYSSEVMVSIGLRLQKEGYYNLSTIFANLYEGEKSTYDFLENIGIQLTENEKNYIDAIASEESKRQEELQNAPRSNAVPDAPFRNNYHEYVLKRLLRMASEEGYDAIGWTPADIQEDRWSSDYAEGYRIEYDQDIPKFLRKYGKKWGATVGTARTTEGYDVWSMDITDSMKQSVLYEGQVMYSDRDSDVDIDAWLDDLSLEELESLLDDYDFLHQEDKDVETEKPKKQRAKRRVDEVNKRLKEIGLSFNGTKTATWTDERIDKYLDGGYYASSNPNYAQAYITYMTPKQFLDLTVGGKQSTLDMILRDSESYGEIDFKKLGDSTPLFLEISEGKNVSKVVGHEGRHRMYLLGKAGFEKVPVLLFDYKTKYDKSYKDTMKLSAQRYNNTDLISRTRDAVVSDVIPFSQGNRDLIIDKFGSGNKSADIHYSDRIDDSVYDVMGENEALKKLNKILTEDVQRLRERVKLEGTVTNGKVFDANQLHSVAVYLNKTVNSAYNSKQLSKDLERLYSYIAHSENIDEQSLFAKCNEIARKILAEQRGEKVVDDYYKGILNDLRSRRISLTEEQIKEVQSQYGDKYRNAFMGKITIAKDGVSLETEWQELASKYPEVFDANTTEADQPLVLLEIYDSARESSVIYQKYNDTESTMSLATEIYNKYWTAPRVTTVADKYTADIKKLNFEHRKAMSDLRADFNDRLHKQRTADAIHYGKIINELRSREKSRVQEAREFGRRRVNEVKERAEKNAKIKSITEKALTLNKWLVKNSKDEHIAEPLKKPVAYLLDAIDFSSKQLLGMNGGSNAFSETKKDISLSKALEQVHDMARGIESSQIGEDDISAIYGTFVDFPVGFADDVRELSGTVNDIMRTVGDNELVLNQMSLEELQTLDKIVSTIKSTVTKMNKFLAVRHAQGVANLSQTDIHYLDSLGKGKAEGGIKKLLNWGNALPYYAFKRFGKGGQKVYEALMDGWDKFAFHTKTIIDYAEDTYTAKEIQEWEKDIKTIKVLEPVTEEEMDSEDYEPTYQTIQMTVPQIMSLYCLQKREQAKSHLIGGGIRIADIEIKKGAKKDVISQSEGVTLSESEISKIIGELTDRQIQVANKLQEFMNTTCTDWGNEVSMLRFGYKAFGEENYFPIQSDKNNLAVNDETENQNSLFRLLNMSFTKSTIKEANNRVVISNIFDVFAQHTSDMAKYNALALPVLDSFKWYNYKEKFKQGETQHKTKSLKQSLENAFGKNAQSYITTFLRDINGSENTSRDTVGKHFFTNAKIASVGANLRVALLQPTSYFRASAVIDSKYLVRAMGHKPKIARAEKYCGIALWKSLGFYDTNIQRGITELIKHEETMKDKAVEIAMKGAEMGDKFTWGVLWNACELEVRDKQKDLKVGSEEFNNAIAKRLREVIYATQVVDSTMTRSQMMRSGDMYDKMLTSFASEPTLSYNMMQDATWEIKLAKRRGEGKAEMRTHRKHFVRVAMAYTITNMMCALVEAGFDAYRDEEEEEMDLATFMKMYLSNFATDMSISAKIPYIKEFISFAQGYSSSRTDTQWMESLGYAMKGAEKIIKKGEGNAYTTFKNIVKAFSYFSGLPVYNIWRDGVSFLDKTDIITSEEMEETFNETLGIE